MQEPSQNCSSNGHHLLAEEFNGMYTIAARECADK